MIQNATNQTHAHVSLTNLLRSYEILLSGNNLPERVAVQTTDLRTLLEAAQTIAPDTKPVDVASWAQDLLTAWDQWYSCRQRDDAAKALSEKLILAACFAGTAYDAAMSAPFFQDKAPEFLLRIFLIALIDQNSPELDPYRAKNSPQTTTLTDEGSKPVDVAAVQVTRLSEDQIKHMVGRFLAWKLPENFNPDGGINFSNASQPVKHEPSGTNLLNWTQAEAMVRHMLEGIVAKPADVAAGLEQAAKFLDQRVHDYVQEHGMTDPSTGVVEFPGWGDEYVSELEDLAEAIRALSPEPAQESHYKKALQRIVNLDEAMGHDLNESHAFEAVAIASKALSAEPAQGEQWQPIETAPRDGTVILAWHIAHKCPVPVLWKDDGFPYQGERLSWFERTYTTAWPERAFSHWMPLPAAPTTEAGK